MIDSVNITAPPQASSPAAVAAPTTASAPVTSAPSTTDSASAASAASPSATKVVVERGQNQLVTVFKVLDQATGAVLTRIPDLEVKATASNPSYQPGAFYNEKA